MINSPLPLSRDLIIVISSEDNSKSNTLKFFLQRKGPTFFLQLAIVWHSSDTATKEKLQKLIFADGIVYERKK